MIEVVVREGLDADIDQLDLQNILKVFVEHLFGGERSLSLYLTDDDEIRQFNLKQRGIDQPTDILSWSYIDEDPQAEWVGDLMISLNRVREQASENGWDILTEMIRVIAHGCAHLAGWDHERSEEEERKMLNCEMEMLKKAGFPSVYNL